MTSSSAGRSGLDDAGSRTTTASVAVASKAIEPSSETIATTKPAIGVEVEETLEGATAAAITNNSNNSTAALSSSTQPENIPQAPSAISTSKPEPQAHGSGVQGSQNTGTTHGATDAVSAPPLSSTPASGSDPEPAQPAAATAEEKSVNEATQHPPRPSTPPPATSDTKPFQEAPKLPVTPAAQTSQRTEANPSVVNSHPDDISMSDAVGGHPSIMGTETTTQTVQEEGRPDLNLHIPAEDHFPPSTPFTPSQAALNQQAYMMMALATISAGPSAMSPPPTVTPSQVTLPNVSADSFNGLASANGSRQPGAESGLESFARIEFADSVFQMTTYGVIIGRDQRALEQARRDEKRAEEYKRRVEENASKGLPPPSPIPHDRSKFSKSYVSEEGGMLGPESDSEENGRPAKRRKTSTAGSSKDENENPQENVISNRQYVSHTPGAAAVDLASLRPSPWHVPFIGIHSPGPNIASKTKAISREHLKIVYNQNEGVFEAIPLHKNGFFCEDVHYKSEKVVLRCGDRLQIKDIDFRFMINGVDKGMTGAEEEEDEATKSKKARGGKEMSFDFEQSHGNGPIQDTSDELSDVDMSPAELSDLGAEDDDEEDDDGDEAEAEGEAEGEGEGAEEGDVEAMEEDEDDSELKQETDPSMDPSMADMPKRRGPGRPPKNGIMSKREQRLLKKQQQEMAKKTVPQAPPIEPPIKRKVGRPRKHPLPDDGIDRPEKRKYKPRKPKGEDGAEGSDAERRAREKKEKRTRPKSPPLDLKIEDYTEEQLQKPNKNYGVLIDETLTAAGPDGLTLKQIYKRICERYPWFHFHTETKGWESSVRHNLIGNEAFKKDETTNSWSRVPGVELDAGKKRKATSPDRGLAAAQGYGPYSYPYTAPHMAPGAPPVYPPGQAAPHGYQVSGYAGQPGHAARPVQYAPAPGAPAQAAQPLAAPPPTQLPGYGPLPAPARPPVGATQPGSYSSPYASRPPPPPPATNGVPKLDNTGVPPLAPGAGQSQSPPSVPSAISHATPGAVPPNQQAAAGRLTQTPPASTPPMRPVIEPRLLAAVVKLKNGLIENLQKARNPQAEAIVMSALNRCVGLKKEATENDKMETICIKGIKQVIDGFYKGRAPPPGTATAGQGDTPAVFETKILSSLNGFKEVSVRALKVKLGEARAEALALSAIDRVIGLADASIVPKPGEGETGGNFEGVEQHLMNSLRQLLEGMNQKLQGTT